MNERITVVIPTINRPHLLKRALESVDVAAAAVDEPVEVVVVDNAHSEETSRVVVEHAGKSAGRVHYARSPRLGGGPARARNHGVRLGSGAYIFFLDDDDEFLPNRFKESLPALAGKEYDAVLERAVRERFEDGVISHFETGPARGANPEPWYFLLGEREETHVAMAAVSVSRVAFEKVGGFNESLGFMGEDGEFLCRLSLATRVGLFGGEPVSLIHQHGGKTSQNSTIRYWLPMVALGALRRSMDATRYPSEMAFLKELISGKLDFALSRCRSDFGYWRRIREGFRVLKYFPLACLSYHNLKSIAVWLVKARPQA